jgi:hypothetical protein
MTIIREDNTVHMEDIMGEINTVHMEDIILNLIMGEVNIIMVVINLTKQLKNWQKILEKE